MTTVTAPLRWPGRGSKQGAWAPGPATVLPAAAAAGHWVLNDRFISLLFIYLFFLLSSFLIGQLKNKRPMTTGKKFLQ